MEFQQEIDRRSFLGNAGVAAIGAGGFAAGIGATAPACKPKDLSSWGTVIEGAFTEIKPLLPELGLSDALVTKIGKLLDQGKKIIQDFDAAYKAGKFADAVTLFTNLGGIITQIAADLNVANNRIVKLALISISIARIAIATLLNNQADARPEVASAVNSAATNDANRKAIAEIKRLATMDLSKLIEAAP